MELASGFVPIEILSQLLSDKEKIVLINESSHPVVPSGKIFSSSKPNFCTSKRACNCFEPSKYFPMLSSPRDVLASSPVISR